MLIPDFTRYSLALLEGEKLIYSACGGGLRPLWDALEKFQGKSGLILHDKVIGLAAARLIVQFRYDCRDLHEGRVIAGQAIPGK